MSHVCPECGAPLGHTIECVRGQREKIVGEFDTSQSYVDSDSLADFWDKHVGSTVTGRNTTAKSQGLSWAELQDRLATMYNQGEPGFLDDFRDYEKRTMRDDWFRGQHHTQGWGDRFFPDDASPEYKCEMLVSRFGPERAFRMMVKVLSEMEDLESVLMVVEAECVMDSRRERPSISPYKGRGQPFQGLRPVYVVHDDVGPDDFPAKPTKKQRPHDHLRDDPRKKRPR